jgi:hypothetical protein
MTESSSSSVPERPPWQFKPGRSGNPGGRPKELLNAQRLAREYTPQAIEALVRGLKDPKHYVAAATALLDRAWGKPVQPLASDEERPAKIEFSWAPASSPADAVVAAPAAATIDAEARPLSLIWENDC